MFCQAAMEFLPNDAKNKLPTPALTIQNTWNSIHTSIGNESFKNNNNKQTNKQKKPSRHAGKKIMNYFIDLNENKNILLFL